MPSKPNIMCLPQASSAHPHCGSHACPDDSGYAELWRGRTLANPGLLSFLQATECFLIREMGYFSQYITWVKEEVSEHTDLCLSLKAYPAQWTSRGVLLRYPRSLGLDPNSQTCHLHSCSHSICCLLHFYPQPLCENQIWTRLVIAF